jgi:alkanesulfonate monooxygenase SsuD/methylene tetrahydromethanopterin reductase-like flavin-dependent oxidoreductase (luciferase family)
VFTAQPTLAEGQAFYADLKRQVVAGGRKAEDLLVLPGLVPVIGSTEAEAQAREDELAGLQVAAYGLRQLSQLVGRDVTVDDLDRPVPDFGPIHKVEGHQSRVRIITEMARRDNLTVRQLLVRLGGGRGHRTFAGTPEQIVHTIEEWFHNGAADGFNVMAAVLPGHLALFVEHVVPLLQKRGLFRSEYTAHTLRGHYGIARPVSQYAAQQSAAE